MKNLFIIILSLLGLQLQAQVQLFGYKDYSLPYQINIGAGRVKTTNPSAFIEIGDSTFSKKGLLPPRGYKDSIPNPVKGLEIFDVPTNQKWWFDGSKWQQYGSVAIAVDTIYRANDTLYWKKRGLVYNLGTYLTKNTADLIYAALGHNHDGRYPLMSGSYSDPSWISSLSWNKISGVPSFIQNQYSAAQSASAWINGRLRIGGLITGDSGINVGNWTTDPSANNGRIGYNSTSNKFRGYVNGSWQNFATENNVILNQNTSAQTANYWINGTSKAASYTSYGSITAAGGVATGNSIINTLVATANNDNLVGIDVQPTFNTSSFSGVQSWGMRTSSLLIGNGFPTASNVTGELNIISAAGKGIAVKATNSSASSFLYFVNSSNGAVGLTADHTNKVLSLIQNGNNYDIQILPSTAKTFKVYYGFGSAGLYSKYVNFPTNTDAATRWGIDQANPTTTLDVNGNMRVNGSWYGSAVSQNLLTDYKALELSPTYNQYAGSTGKLYGIYYNPTLTSVLGKHYSFFATSGNHHQPLPTFADDASAGAGGLVTDDWYKTPDGTVKIKL